MDDRLGLMQSRRNPWIIPFVAVTIGMLVLKLFLAVTTTGAADISLWKDFLARVNECGVCVYKTGGVMLYPGGSRVNPFNHPPFIIHFMRLIAFIATHTGLAFETAFRSVTSLVDVGSAVVLYHLTKREGIFRPAAFLLYLLAPATIIISGYHGNTDTVMIFFVLLAALLISKPWLAGLGFGMALNIKLVPIVFLLAFVLKYDAWRTKLMFLGAIAGVIALGSLPFLLQDPVAIARGVLGYSGFSGRWGLSRALFASLGPSETYQIATRLSAYLLLLYLLYLSWKTTSQSLLNQLGLLAFTFLAFTPAWGTNYMAWLDPFPIVLGVGPSAGYYLISGAMLYYLYFVSDDESTRLIALCWIAVLVLMWLFLKRTRSKKKPADHTV
jgi:Glycosyltransferase family 87